MIKIIFKLFYLLLANAIALYSASFFVSGFNISHDLYNLIEIVIIFTLINLFIRPILKIIFSPIIMITLGLGVIVVNALMLYLLSLLLESVYVAGLYPLIYATLIIGIANFILHIIFKKLNH